MPSKYVWYKIVMQVQEKCAKFTNVNIKGDRQVLRFSNFSVLKNNLNTFNSSMLLERGADLRKDDCDGCIPALVAQKYSSVECFDLLEHHTKERDGRLIQEASEV